MSLLLAAVVTGLLIVPAALAGTGNGTYQKIYADLTDNGRLDGTYTPAELQALADDPTVQGYGQPTVPQTPVCVPAQPGQPVTSENAMCSPCQQGQVVGSNGSCTTPCQPGQTAGANGQCVPVCQQGQSLNGQGQCVTTEQPATPTPPTSTVAVGTAPPSSGVLGASKTVSRKIAAPKPTSGVAGVSATRPAGTLPFTGIQLTIFALIGAALVAGGLLLRTTSRRRTDS